MASRELQLLSRVLRTGDIKSVIDWGITADDFRTGVANSMFKYVLAYHSNVNHQGAVIGQQAALNCFPNFQLADDPGMTTEALCLEVRKNRIDLQMNEEMDKIRVASHDDPLGAVSRLAALSKTVAKLTEFGKRADITADRAVVSSYDRYVAGKAGMERPRPPWAWPALQAASGGICHDDYVVMYGRPGVMKSWVLLYMAAEMIRHGKRVLFYTKEMSTEEVADRLASLVSMVPYQLLDQRKLSLEQEWTFYHAGTSVVNAGGGNTKILSGKDADGRDTVEWLEAKVNDNKPDAVFVDGMYLMSATDMPKNSGNHDRVRKISNQLRQMALTTQVPVICTIQANREAAKNKTANTSEVSFSDAVGQDATVVFRVMHERPTNSVLLVLAKGRKLVLSGEGIRINAVPSTDFTQKGSNAECLITKDDVNKHEDEGPKAHTTPRSMLSRTNELDMLNQRMSQASKAGVPPVQ